VLFLAGLIVGVACTFLIGERVFRRIVTPQIADIFENVPPFNVVPVPPAPDAVRVTFPTADGLQLTGSLLNAGRKEAPGLVLFLPELRGTHWMASRYCETLLERGFVVFSFDFRNQGESESCGSYAPIHWLTEFEMKDVAAAMEFIESDSRLSTLPLVAFGVSRGGVAALLTGCRYPRIRAVICDSGFGTMSMIRFFVDRFVRHVIPQWVYRLLPAWHVEVTLKQAVQLSENRRNVQYVHLEDEVAGLDSSSVLLISGGRDSYVTPEIAGRLRDIVGPAAELWIADGAKHNMSRATRQMEYDQRVLRHVESRLSLPVTVDSPSPAAGGRPDRTGLVHSAISRSA
jgi:uncharacterized protein